MKSMPVFLKVYLALSAVYVLFSLAMGLWPDAVTTLVIVLGVISGNEVVRKFAVGLAALWALLFGGMSLLALLATVTHAFNGDHSVVVHLASMAAIVLMAVIRIGQPLLIIRCLSDKEVKSWLFERSLPGLRA